jgi:hypothetical protein
MEILMSKQDVIDRLNEQLPLARTHDAERIKAHRADEVTALKAFRAGLKEAAKWDYKTALANGFRPNMDKLFRNSNGYERNSPDCPILVAPAVEKALRNLAFDHRKTYTLNPNGIHRGLYELITWSPNPINESPC